MQNFLKIGQDLTKLRIVYRWKLFWDTVYIVRSSAQEFNLPRRRSGKKVWQQTLRPSDIPMSGGPITDIRYNTNVLCLLCTSSISLCSLATESANSRTIDTVTFLLFFWHLHILWSLDDRWPQTTGRAFAERQVSRTGRHAGVHPGLSC